MLSFILTSPSETVRHDDVKSISLPAYQGRLQILHGHSEAFLVLTDGTAVIVYADGHEEHIEITTCECHVTDDEVVLLL